MNTLKTVLFLGIISMCLKGAGQTMELHDYIVASIEKSRALYLKRDSLVRPQPKTSNLYESPYEEPNTFKSVPQESKAENRKANISVNGKSVDLDFLKLLAISDTVSVVNIVGKLGYKPPYQFTRMIAINGWVKIEVDKKVFRDLWKIEKAKYRSIKR